MPRKATTKDAIKKNTIRDMTTLHVYKPEYDPIIDIYSELREQYEKITAEFVRVGYQYESNTGAGGAKKAPIVATLENLRKDILAYSDRLCLNPKANDTVKIESPKGSRLEAALERLEKN